MRVIAGKAGSLKLKTIDGSSTRPTTDRIKETLFNMIQPSVCDSIFLDLFAGSGGIGIEALSRGAKKCVFVENNRAASACIRENLSFTRLDDRGEVLEMDVMTALERLKGKGQGFDIIFMDPPYEKGYERQVLSQLKDLSIADSNTIIIVEASMNTDFSYVMEYGMKVLKEKRYKSNKHVFMQKSGGVA